MNISQIRVICALCNQQGYTLPSTDIARLNPTTIDEAHREMVPPSRLLIAARYNRSGVGLSIGEDMMATIALIQDLFPVLLHPSGEALSGLERQIYDNFFEALEEEYNHDLQVAETLDAYQESGHAPPDVIICAPFEEGVNPASGLAQLSVFKEAFPGLPVIVWSVRSEESLRTTCLDDLGCAAYYTGTLLGAPEDLPGLIAEALA